MEFKVLSKTERKWLRKVKTTDEAAQQIIERCQPLLDFAESLPTRMADIEKIDDESWARSFHIGCPHCTYDTCNDCPWHALFGIIPQPNDDDHDCCLDMPFGGNTLATLRFRGRYIRVIFWDTSESLRVDFASVLDIICARQYRKEIRECKRFFIGHIEWANGVLTGEL